MAARVLSLAEQNRENYPSMYESIVGILTFGTPFGGAPVADIAAEWAKIHEATGTAISSRLLDLLTPGNESLRELKHEFARSIPKLTPKVDVHCFYERNETSWEDIIAKLANTDFPLATLNKLKLKQYREFVSMDSAMVDGAGQTGLARTHRDLVRFESFKDSEYQLVRSVMKKMIHSAPLSAKARLNYTKQSSIDSTLLKEVLKVFEGADVEGKLRHLSQRLASDSWILDEPEYQDWLENKQKNDDFLWIHGPEGKGKTTAVTAVIKKIDFIITEQEKDHADRASTLLAYFFCDQTRDYCTAEDVVKSLLRQLCQQQNNLAIWAKQFRKKPAGGINPNKTEHGNSTTNSSTALGIENLWQTLRDMLTDSSIGTVYFVISNLHDLDETSESTQKFFSFLKAAIGQSDTAESTATGKRVRTRWLFATRDRIKIQNVFGSSPTVRKIDLSDTDKYGDKVKLELQRHAWTKVDSLREQKGYNKAIAYFASSVIGTRADSTKWIDAAIVQLAALPAKANDIRVRKMLEGVPQDFATLLDRAWKSVSSFSQRQLTTPTLTSSGRFSGQMRKGWILSRSSSGPWF